MQVEAPAEIAAPAARDRAQIVRYTLSRFGPTQARKLQHHLREAVSHLARFPGSRRKAPHLDPGNHGIRCFAVPPTFLIVYRIVEPAVGSSDPPDLEVIRLLHGSRNLIGEFKGRDTSKE